MHRYRITLGFADSVSWVVEAASLADAYATVGPYSLGSYDRVIVERVG